MSEPDIDTDRIDEAVLALLYLTLHEWDRELGYARAWKTFDWETMNRLHEKGMIHDPVGKAKSVALTREGIERTESLFHQLFVKRADGGAASAQG
ncbi:MAG: DUF6429 family protein [Caulobacteraceae bacterium]|nr:DUF6429 family protein [Caulobacteraceae bacterium]